MQRGIIGASSMTYIGDGVFTNGPQLTPQDLRYFLLYWDRVVIPGNNLFWVAIPEEDDFLATGVLERPIVKFSGSFDAEGIAKAQIFSQTHITQQLLEKDTSTDWTIHQFGNQIVLPEHIISQQTIRVELLNALPAPPAQAALFDILEFKNRNNSALNDLHAVLNDLYFEILKSPDTALTSKLKTSDLNKIIQSIDSSASRKWEISKKYTLSSDLNINIGNITAGFLAGTAFDAKFSTAPIGTFFGPIASMLSIKLSETQTIEAARQKLVLSYLTKANKENLLQKSNT